MNRIKAHGSWWFLNARSRWARRLSLLAILFPTWLMATFWLGSEALINTLTTRPTETPVLTATQTQAPTSTASLSATEPPVPTPTRGQVATLSALPAPTFPPYTHTLKTYHGQGFSFRYPAGARLKEAPPDKDPWQRVVLATHEIHIIGPQVRIRPGNADGSYRGSAYELVVRTYENPDRLDAEAWAREYIHTSWREAMARRRPWGSLPVSETGEIDERKVENVVVDDQPGFLVWYFGFDSSQPAYYVATDRQILELSFRLYPVANQPLAMVQRDVYALILGTLNLE